MKTRLLNKHVLRMAALVMVLAATFSMGTTQKAEALPPVSTDCTYYSDASYTTEVGWIYVACNGRRYSSGTTSPYKLCDSIPCY